jgi:hypothetical protein
MHAAVVPILKPFEGGGWQEQALASAESGLGVCRGLISAAGGRSTPQTAATTLLLLRRLDGKGGLLL